VNTVLPATASSLLQQLERYERLLFEPMQQSDLDGLVAPPA
jgi:hypothetical protein